MAFEFEGGLGLTESDLPTLVVREHYGYQVLETEDGSWSFDVADDTTEDAMYAVKVNLAYWLWRKRNPELANPVDPEVHADLVNTIISKEWDTTEELATVLARAGFTRDKA